ncbi:hypothetical protein [Moorena sp. SIO4G3]|uniref:hypothetical protein n=1 Tax=Moorena sp. SIO4G3 TaxID=2607821 RepID=UPI0025E3B5B2|nr:hypothetical protein [Moorena sp. SIO4G3]
MGETTAVAGGTAVAHGGNPQDRAASPRPRCLPKTALHRYQSSPQPNLQDRRTHSVSRFSRRVGCVMRVSSFDQ